MPPRRRNKIAEQFSARVISMLNAPAYRELSLSARRVLDRLEIEHANHGGFENGRLPVTYQDFVDYGIERHCIAPAIRELEVLGFIEVTERGRAGNAEWRAPNKFRLTYRITDQDRRPTDEWRRVSNLEEARALARAARAPIKRKRVAPKSGAEKLPSSVCEKRIETEKCQ